MKTTLLVCSMLLLLSGLPIDQDLEHPVQVKTELYMGLSDRDGKPIPKRKWEAFKKGPLVDILGGYTELPGSGYWRNEQGKAYSEKSVVIVYVHEHNSFEDQKIDSLIALFKKEFDQESVLQIDMQVAYSFE